MAMLVPTILTYPRSFYIPVFYRHCSIPIYHVLAGYHGFRACSLDVDPRCLCPMQSFITGLHNRHCSYHSCNARDHRLYDGPIVPMAMDYIDHLPSMVICNSRYWRYCIWSESYRDIVHYLHCGSTLEHCVVFVGYRFSQSPIQSLVVLELSCSQCSIRR